MHAQISNSSATKISLVNLLLIPQGSAWSIGISSVMAMGAINPMVTAKNLQGQRRTGF